jgi:hypothetical protein
VALILSACEPSTSGGVGSCGSPAISIEPADAAPGDQATIVGSDFAQCIGPGSTGVPPPYGPVEILVVSDSQEASLGTVQPDENGTFEFELTIPDDASVVIARYGGPEEEDATAPVG